MWRTILRKHSACSLRTRLVSFRHNVWFNGHFSGMYGLMVTFQGKWGSSSCPCLPRFLRPCTCTISAYVTYIDMYIDESASMSSIIIWRYNTSLYSLLVWYYFDICFAQFGYFSQMPNEMCCERQTNCNCIIRTSTKLKQAQSCIGNIAYICTLMSLQEHGKTHPY